MSPNGNALDPLPLPLLQLSSVPQLQLLPPETQTTMLYGSEASSSSSNRLNEHPLLVSSPALPPRHKSLKPSTGKSSFSANHHYNETSLKQELGLVTVKAKPKPEIRGKNQCKNLITERNRRNRIKDALFTLRALVPKISKVKLEHSSQNCTCYWLISTSYFQCLFRWIGLQLLEMQSTILWSWRRRSRNSRMSSIWDKRIAR